MRPALPRRLLAALLLAIALPASPQTPSALAEWQFSGGVPLRAYFLDTPPPTWTYTVGLAFIEQPKYAGSRRYQFQPGPTFDIRYRDVAFVSTGEGLGWNALQGKTYRIGLALSYDLGRRLSRQSRNRGIGDSVQGAPEFKLFAEYVWVPVTAPQPLPIVFRGDVRRAVGGYNGMVGDMGFYLPVFGSRKFFVLVGPSITYGNDAFMGQFFGARAGQLPDGTPVPEFKAEAGFKSWTFGSNAYWMMSERWRLDIVAAGTRLFGDAAASPSTQRKTQLAFSLSLDYTWDKP